MMASVFNIFLTGVGGQGIGMLSEILLRAVDHAGFMVKAVDTHGLAQRGGIVVSQIRIGEAVYSPLIQSGCADLVIALERHEALRAMAEMLREKGTLIYYDAVWQPLDVRLGKAKTVKNRQIDDLGRTLNARVIRVHRPELQDARMQNVAVLGLINKYNLVRGVESIHYQQAMADLMAGAGLEANLHLFKNVQNEIKV